MTSGWDLIVQQICFDAFRKEFNFERPHEARGLKPPARLYRLSPRTFPSKIAEVEYPGHDEVRRVSQRGNFKWKGQGLLAKETLAEVEGGL